jgi:hypothetical protein
LFFTSMKDCCFDLFSAGASPSKRSAHSGLLM